MRITAPCGLIRERKRPGWLSTLSVVSGRVGLGTVEGCWRPERLRAFLGGPSFPVCGRSSSRGPGLLQGEVERIQPGLGWGGVWGGMLGNLPAGGRGFGRGGGAFFARGGGGGGVGGAMLENLPPGQPLILGSKQHTVSCLFQSLTHLSANWYPAPGSVPRSPSVWRSFDAPQMPYSLDPQLPFFLPV